MTNQPKPKPKLGEFRRMFKSYRRKIGGKWYKVVNGVTMSTRWFHESERPAGQLNRPLESFAEMEDYSDEETDRS